MLSQATATGVIRTAGHQYLTVPDGRSLLGVTRVLDAVGITDYSAPWFTEWHKVRGQRVHEMVALENQGTLNDQQLDERLLGFLDGYRRFRAEEGGEIEFCEQIVSDVTLGAAGTLDLILRHPSDHTRRRRLYDIKPSDAAATAIQTAAYARFARPLYDEAVLFSRWALVLPGDGTYRAVPFDDPNDEQVFLAALRVAHWRVAHGRC